MTITVNSIPFSKIVAIDEINARPSTKDGLDELAASIAAKGVIQPLCVRPGDKADTYEVIDGRRRHAAIARLVRDKVWRRSDLVPVIVRNEDDTAALETSLMANTVRLPMHPVDQHEVFARLEEQGRSDAEIAERFGITERTVQQRKALGRLSPVIRKAWKAGKIDQTVAQAFTLGSHAEQDEAWSKLKSVVSSYGGLQPRSVRQELAHDRKRRSDVPAALLELYDAAGGRCSNDLFEDAVYLEDAALLKELHAKWEAEMVAATRERVAGQGWAWVAMNSELPKEWRWRWDILRGGLATDEDDERMNALEELANEAEDRGDAAEAARLDAEREAIEAEAELRGFTPEMRARSGVVLSLEEGGHVSVTFGVVRPSEDGQQDLEDAIDDVEDDGDDQGDESAADLGSDDEPAADPQDPPFAISAALSQSVSEALTIAVARAVADDPNLAMLLVTAALECRHSAPAAIRNDGHALVRKHGTADFSATFLELLNAPASDVLSWSPATTR